MDITFSLFLLLVTKEALQNPTILLVVYIIIGTILYIELLHYNPIIVNEHLTWP